MKLRLLAAGLLLLCGFSVHPVQAQQQMIDCAPNTPCTSAGPFDTKTGDPLPVAAGKINSNDSQLYGMFPSGTGILKANGGVPAPLSIANALDMIALWTGCSSPSTMYLRADGVCGSPSGSGAVSSVGLSAPSVFSVTGTPVTSSGTLALSFAPGQTANQFLATTSGTIGPLGLRSIVTADLPQIPLSTGVTGALGAINGGSGTNGSLSGLVKANGTNAYTAAVSSDITNLWSGTCSSATFLRGDGSCQAPSGGGSVTSVGLTAPSVFTVTGSPVTGASSLGLSFATGQATNQVLSTGSAGTLALRSLVAADLPSISLTTGVSGTLPIANGGTGATSLAAANIPVITGTPTSGHCVEWLSATVLEDSGAGCGSGGSTAFSALTGSTNTTAAMLVGTGASLGATGSGTITATAAPIAGVTGMGTGVGTFLVTPSSSNLAATVTGATGTGALVFGTSPTITLANGTGLPISTGVSGLGTGVATFLATPSSANLAAAMTDETGTGANVFGTAPTISSPTINTAATLGYVTGSIQCLHVNSSGAITGTGSDCGSGGSTAFSALTGSTNTTAAMVVGTGASIAASGSGTITATAAPVAGITGFGTGIGTFLATPSSANLASAVTGETGSGALVFGTSPSLTSPSIATGETLGFITGLTQCLHVNTSGVVSGTGSDCGSGGSTAFSGLSTGTNTSATMTVGTGGSLTFSGAGVVNADQVNGGTVPASAAILATNSSSQPTALTLGNNLSVASGVLLTTQPINAQTGTTYTFLTTDAGKLVTASNAASQAYTLPVATTTGFTSGYSFDIQNKGVGTVTITPTTSTINGSSTLTLAQNTGCTVSSDGTNYQVSACNALGGGGGSSAFNSITTGTNTTATMTVGSGGTLTTSGSGVLNANQVNGATVPASAAILASNSSSQATALTLGNNLVIAGGALSTTQAINAQTGTTYAIQASDAGKLISASNAASQAYSIVAATTTGFTAGYSFDIQNKGAGTVTITPTTSTINGSSTLAIAQNQGCTVSSDGTNYQVSACSALGGAGLSAIANNTVIANVSGSSAVPTATSAVNMIGLLNSATCDAQTGTTYTLALGDANTCVTMSNAASNTLTVPTNASVALPVGTTITVEQLGAGVTTVSPATGVTFTSLQYGSSGTQTYALAGTYDFLQFKQVSANTWLVTSVGPGRQLQAGTTNLAATTFGGVTGTLPLGNGGIGATTLAGASIAQFTAANPVSGHCPQWSGTTGLLVDSGAACGGGGSPAFSSITTGSNTTATMTVGTGGSLTTSGTGTINANQLGGSALTTYFAAPPAIGGTTAAAGSFTTLASSTGSAFATTSSGTTMGAIASHPSLTVTGAANEDGIQVNGNATSGQSYGIGINAGTTSADNAFVVGNQAGTANFEKVFGDGGIVFGNATGGDEGANTVNIPSLYVSGTTNFTGITGSTQCLHVNTSGVLSGTGSDCGSGGSTAFSALTASTNTTAAMVVGTGASLAASGSGTITATAAPVTGITGLGTGVATFLATPSSANLAAAMTDETGTGANVFASSPTMITPAIKGSSTGTNTIAAANASATNYTDTLPAATGTFALLSLAETWSAVQTFGTNISIGGVTATGATGTGAAVFGTSPTLSTPALGTPSAINLSNATAASAPIATLATVAANTVLANVTGSTASATAASAASVIGVLNSTACNAQTGTTYTLVLGDSNLCITMSNVATNTLTIPTNASVALPVGTTITVEQLGAGLTSIAPATGVTLQSLPYGSSGTQNYPLAGQYDFIQFKQTAANTWLMTAYGAGRGAPPMDRGATFTIASGTGGCATTGTLVGGTYAGKFNCTGTAGASTVTITLPSATTLGGNDWNCSGSDVTDGVVAAQSGLAATSCVLKFTTSSNPATISFAAHGY